MQKLWVERVAIDSLGERPVLQRRLVGLKRDGERDLPHWTRPPSGLEPRAAGVKRKKCCATRLGDRTILRSV
jgi:hypothetical protein